MAMLLAVLLLAHSWWCCGAGQQKTVAGAAQAGCLTLPTSLDTVSDSLLVKLAMKPTCGHQTAAAGEGAA
jgi:hypothetical protein